HYISDSYLPAKVGDVFVIPPNVPHGYYTDNRFDIYHILLKNSFKNRYHEELRQIPGYEYLFEMEPLIRQASGSSYHLHIERDKFGRFMNKMTKLTEVENSGRYMYENILVLDFISQLGNLIMEERKITDDSEVIGIMEYIHRNFPYSISLEDIAKFSNMSISTLNRRFKKLVNLTPMQYVMNCRIQAAKELMEQDKYSKTEIAQLCGFYDLAHMNKYVGRF
ncbi:MAG: helix-turn-helix transcriptional regulator, partial [Candidatus Heritagella sp.]